MKLIKYIIFCFIIVSIVSIAGCLNNVETEQLDVIEYNLGNAYFVYVDDEGIIKKITWDKSGWNSDSYIVEIKKSNYTYAEKKIFSDTVISQTRYVLYLNTSDIPQR